MDFGILGPLEAHRDGVPISPGGPKQRALLALLLVRANEAVSRDALIDGLWGERPPETAAKALQVYVSQLRRVLGRELVRTGPGGYQLVVEPESVDLCRFERLAAEARGAVPEAASAKLREALELWRGAALADVADAPFAAVEAGRIEELRVAAAEELADAELALGRHGELVPELERLVAQNPLRERLRGRLMLALYRSGRQAEALEVYQDARRRLVDELGIEPGRMLRELHQAVLNQDPALEPPLLEQPRDDSPVRAPAPQAKREPAAREVRKTVTAVVVGLAISSARQEGLDPEALRHVLGRALVEVDLAVTRHGGTIETVTGDAVTAVFGLPAVHEDDALRGVRAAAEAREALLGLTATLAAEGSLELELDFGIGVSTGEVVTAAESTPQLWATGEPLTLSSQLGQAARPCRILVDETTRRLVRDAIVAEPANGAWSVTRLAEATPGHVRRLASPMVGRERERRRLHDAFDQAVSDRSCQLFTVLGAAGVGKSRLVREFLGDVAGIALVARGRCLPYGEGITYWPLLEAVKEAVGLEDGDSPGDAHARVVAALQGEEGAELLAQRVAELVGLVEAESRAEEAFTAVRSLFESLARVDPLVLVFDDIHWGEATFLDLVEHLADWSREAPILLLCLARPELLDGRTGWGGGKLNATTTLLEPLSDVECALQIENLVGGSELAEEAERRIAEAAEGNPLFVEEMLSMLIDDGLLVHQGGGWSATGDVSAIRVPPTIQALLAARLDRLEATERAVIERAAVGGKVFYEGAVAELAPNALRPAVAESLAALVRKELIRPARASLGERTFRFRHLLIRDAAYESIPKEARADLHERFGRWLEGATGERSTEYEEVLGYHLEQSYRYRVQLGTVDEAARALAREAAERLGAAGRRAFVRSDAPAAVNLISRAVSLLPADDPLRVDLLPNVRAVQGVGDLAWAEKALTEAIEAAATSGDRSLAANALVQRGFLRLFTDREVGPGELIDVAERAIAVFEELDDHLALARAWRLVAQAHYLDRRLARCAEASERAYEHVRTAGDRFEEREIVDWLVVALLLGPMPAMDAVRRCERLLEETRGEPLLQALIFGGMAPLVLMHGRTTEVDDLMERAQATMEAAGERLWIVSFQLALVHLWRGDPVAAEQELRPAYEALSRIGEKTHFSSIAHALSTAAYLLGRYAEAEELTHECEEAARPNDVHSQVIWRSTRAKLLARRGEHEAAERLCREAVGLASSSDFRVSHAEALIDLAEVLSLGDDPGAAKDILEQAIRSYELKGNVFGAEQARSRLEAKA